MSIANEVSRQNRGAQAYRFLLAHDGSAAMPNGSELWPPALREPVNSEDGNGGRELRSAGMTMTPIANALPPLHGGLSRCVP
jgi:hypothetical protein